MPVSSISRSAKGAASSSAVSALAPKREYVLDLTLRKLAQSLLLLKRASGDFADPQKALRLKRWTGKKAIKMLHQSHLVWVCPECQTKFEGRYGSVISPPP
jgi:hypothetical protein